LLSLIKLHARLEPSITNGNMPVMNSGSRL